MSFEPVLRAILDDCPDVFGVALMGSDGIPIQELDRESVVEGVEVSGLGAEFGRILDEVRKTADAVGGGALEEVVVRIARFWVLLRSVDEETFLVMALQPDANLGKARYLIRRHLSALREHL